MLALGAQAVALTSGPGGVLVAETDGEIEVAAYEPPRVVDQTGAGDVLAGTTAARLALGDDLVLAVQHGAAAAALSLQGAGGTGHLATLDEVRRLVADRTPSGVTT